MIQITSRNVQKWEISCTGIMSLFSHLGNKSVRVTSELVPQFTIK